MKTLNNNFENVKNSVINYINTKEMQDLIYLENDRIIDCNNILELKKVVEEVLFTSLYNNIETVNKLVEDLFDAELIELFDIKMLYICIYVFYTNNNFTYNVNFTEILSTDKIVKYKLDNNIEVFEIIKAIRLFKEYNEEF